MKMMDICVHILQITLITVAVTNCVGQMETGVCY